MMAKRFFFILLVFSASLHAIQKPAKDNRALFSKIIKLTKKNIYNPEFLKTDTWQKFKTYMMSDSILDLPQLEFAKTFNRQVKIFPFTHYYIYENKAREKQKETSKPFTLEKINHQTSLLRITRFANNALEMENIIASISKKASENLIIDLRGNRGGTLDAAIILGQFLTSKQMDSGIYLNRSWFEANPRYPIEKEIESFVILEDMSYKGFMKLSKEKAFRVVLPAHNRETFKGRVYVLTDKNTASTCEPFVYLLKDLERVTVIGETTAGAMMSGKAFVLNKSFSLFIPVTDYITSDGKRIDKVGVTPDVKTSSDNAFAKALELINEQP